jgi:hypothetical protein
MDGWRSLFSKKTSDFLPLAAVRLEFQVEKQQIIWRKAAFGLGAQAKSLILIGFVTVA